VGGLTEPVEKSTSKSCILVSPSSPWFRAATASSTPSVLLIAALSSRRNPGPQRYSSKATRIAGVERALWQGAIANTAHTTATSFDIIITPDLPASPMTSLLNTTT
jgi:hypothetical protein